jgi:RecB family exonuclease
VVPDSRLVSAFLNDAVAWSRDGDEQSLMRLIRSPFSGVPHDIGAAYATVARRTGGLLEAIERQRLALPASDRDAVLQFGQRARRIRVVGENDDDDTLLGEAIAQEFAIPAPVVQPDSSGTLGAAVALAEPIDPEKGTGLPTRPRHFSASALNAYVECARKWFYRYACAAIEDRGSSASVYGTAFHLALEDFHGEFPRPSARDERLMRDRMREYVTWAFERNREGFDTQVEFELQRRRAQRTAQRYVDWLIAQEQRAPFVVIGREVPANLDLGGHAFIGFIDRLDRDERSGGIGVVDYKTGSIATSASEYREKVRQFRDFQLPFYYWARTEEGDRVTSLALIPLKDALLDVRPIVLEVVPVAPPQSGRRDAATGTVGIDELNRARVRMIELCDELASGERTHFAVTRDASACTYCAYATACAFKPAADPERFAR